MTVKIEVLADLKVGDKDITDIFVEPLKFADLANLWTVASRAPGKASVTFQRLRILHQTHFMSGDDRVTPDAGQLSAMSRLITKPITAALEAGQGAVGEVIQKGDGISSPILYKLGTPVIMKNGDNALVIEELEFMAATHGETEDVLAAENEMKQAVALIQTVANPVQAESLTRLPSWAVDQMTVADGYTIMNEVLPSF